MSFGHGRGIAAGVFMRVVRRVSKAQYKLPRLRVDCTLQ